MQDRLIGGAQAALTPDELQRANRIGTETPFDDLIDEVLASESGNAHETLCHGHRRPALAPQRNLLEGLQS